MLDSVIQFNVSFVTLPWMKLKIYGSQKLSSALNLSQDLSVSNMLIYARTLGHDNSEYYDCV